MTDDPQLSEPDAPTRSIGPTVSDVSGLDASTAPLLSAGQTFGPYLVVRLLGRGGMGEVYEAEDRDNGRRVALKVLSQGLTAPVDRARFIREGRLAAGISHPNTVYVYGTDEIQGVPVIAMELAPGGTLKDLVKGQGQIAPAKAVDAILQVISGLEAAADAGVLHRDVKPSNCFVDSDGRVKVGDFGLSISTHTFGERSLTMLGTVLGTPGFSSPEQLRGDELDVRSDIYSVGATLYYLLTGRPPFDDANVIRLVTQVAQQMPRSPRVVRSDVPGELAAVVMRCLAKRPEDRLDGYEALRSALEPFSSSAPVPAALGVRFAAGLVDNLTVTLLSFPVISIWWNTLNTGNTEGVVPGSIAGWLVVIFYYGLTEGAWGRSPGKQLFGLRVVDASNQRPGVPRALRRSTIWALADGVPMLVYSYAVMPRMGDYQNTPLGALIGLSFPALNLFIVAAMFIPARRVNGFSAVHDRVSGTRVVFRRHQWDRRLAGAPAPAPSTPARGDRVGPYVLLDERPLDIPQVRAGYDDRLRRKVWIHAVQPGEPPVAGGRRLLSRPTRLRWLSGRRTAAEAWDAYEAPEGARLLAPGMKARPWSEVRAWIAELAAELRAAQAEDAVLPLSLERVWITPAGGARLLDWGVPSAEPLPPQQFLHAVGARGLRGVATAGSAGLDVPLPVQAHAFLARLERAGFDGLEAVLQDAAALVREPAAVGRGRRAGHLLLSALPAGVLMGIMLAVSVAVTWTQTSDASRADLTEALMRLDRFERNPRQARDPGEARAFEVYVASRHAALAADPATWSEGWSLLRFNPRLRTIAGRAIAAHSNPSPAEIEAAAKMVEPFLATERQKTARMMSARGVMAITLFTAAGVSVIMASLGLVSALLFRGGLMFALFGIAVVSASGHSSRWRGFVRAAIAWSPVVLAGIAIAREAGVGRIGWMLVEAASLALLLGGVAYAVRHPERGLQDRLAGTWLVPR